VVDFSNALISDAGEKRSVAFVKVDIIAGVLRRKDLTSLSFLTTYRPNFCCECGDKIVRLRWRPWISRRFCDNCFRRESVKADWLRSSVLLCVVLLVGILIGRGSRRERPPLVIERPAQQSSQTGTPPAQAPSTYEQVYICGARTKKGTPCSRRVHGPVRCWQHKGLPSMISVKPIE
jgi:hypothetical protein